MGVLNSCCGCFRWLGGTNCSPPDNLEGCEGFFQWQLKLFRKWCSEAGAKGFVFGMCGLAYFVFSLLLVCWVNTFAYERVPWDLPPLPDIIMDTVEGYTGHKRPYILPLNVTDVASIVGFGGALFATIFQLWFGIGWEPFGRLCFVHGGMLNFRAMLFMCTTLPIPSERGLCRQNPMPGLNSGGGRFFSGLSWIFAFGFDGLKKVPQCGDLLPSGHTIFITVNMLHFHRSLPKYSDWRIRLFVIFTYTLLFGALVNIVLLRNHYTVDVVISFILTLMLFTIVNQNLDLYKARGGQWFPIFETYSPHQHAPIPMSRFVVDSASSSSIIHDNPNSVENGSLEDGGAGKA